VAGRVGQPGIPDPLSGPAMLTLVRLNPIPKLFSPPPE
jgi:hypothetical protein